MMKGIIWTCVEVVVAIIAAVIGIGAMALCGFTLHFFPYIVFLAIILYYLAYKKLGILGFSVAVIIAAIYLVIMFLSTLVKQPLFCLMSSLMPMTAVILMLRRKPLWVWGVVALIFLTIGVYYVFHNDIKGPMEFMISDRPIDVPAQWHHCYRFFWTGIVVETVTDIAGFVSVIFLSVLPLKKNVRKACERLEM